MSDKNPETATPGGSVAEPTVEEMQSLIFAQMVIQQSNMAMMLLGKTPHPESGKPIRDLEAARLFIDQLEVLELKTKGNLSREEAALLKQSLMTLRLAFVEAVESPAASKPAEPASTPEAPAGGTEQKAGPAAGAGPAGPTSATGEEESRKRFSKKFSL